jgi:hypothetical protein
MANVLFRPPDLQRQLAGRGISGAEFEVVFCRYLGADRISGAVELLFVNEGSAPTTRGVAPRGVREGFVRTIMLNRDFHQHILLSCG